MSSKKSKIFKSMASEPQDMGVGPSGRDFSNGPVRLEIESLAAGGRGLARHEGEVWFVPGTVPGDLALVVARRSRKRFVEGELLRIARPSPLRREPPCPFQAGCGGCPWMVLPEAEQAEWKRRTLLDALERIGRIDGVRLDPLVAPGTPTGYRNKVEFSLGLDGSGRPAVGLHAEGGGGPVIDLPGCLVQHEAANELLGTARRALLSPRPDPAGFRGGREGPRLVLRRSWATGQMLVVLRESVRPFPRSGALVREIRARHPEVCGIVRLRAQPGRRGGSRAETLFGQPWIEEQLAGRSFRLPASTFVQVNSEAAAELVRLVVEAGGPADGRRVVDLYGGVGAYGFALLARGAERVAVCDADGAAVACGRAAAREASEPRIRHHRADARCFLDESLRRKAGCDLLVANPPRTGLGPGVAAGILALRPSRIVVVSCSPATLARDLRELIRGGCRLDRVVPVDMFPQTAHVEAVAALSGPAAP